MDFLPLHCFSSAKLAIWFAQAESVFAINDITADSEKYHYIVAYIPLEYTSIVEDILLNPPTESKYDYLKCEFIKRMSIYRLKKEKLGLHKPSEYLRRLITIADKRVPTKDVLNTWLENLPKPVREVVSLESSGRVEIVGPMADKVMALLPTKQSQHSSPPSFDQLKTTLRGIGELAKQVQIVQLMINNDLCVEIKELPRKQELVVNTGNKNDETNAEKNKPGSQKTLCWYHMIFGDQAMTCAAPCQYNLSALQQ